MTVSRGASSRTRSTSAAASTARSTSVRCSGSPPSARARSSRSDTSREARPVSRTSSRRPALAAFGVGGRDEHRLGERLHPGQGGAQLVGRVGEEAAQLVGGAPGACLRVLERVQGIVERGGGPAELGAGAVGGEPGTPVARRDPLRDRGHPVEGAQRRGHPGEQGEPRDGQRAERGGDHHPAKQGTDLGDRGRVRDEGQPRPVGQGPGDHRAGRVGRGRRRGRGSGAAPGPGPDGAGPGRRGSIGGGPGTSGPPVSRPGSP